MRPRRVHFSIDRLVLDGIGREERAAVTAALAAELQRQFAGSASAWGASRQVDKLRPQAPCKAAGVDGAALGAAFARGIGEGLKS